MASFLPACVGWPCIPLSITDKTNNIHKQTFLLTVWCLIVKKKKKKKILTSGALKHQKLMQRTPFGVLAKCLSKQEAVQTQKGSCCKRLLWSPFNNLHLSSHCFHCSGTKALHYSINIYLCVWRSPKNLKTLWRYGLEMKFKHGHVHLFVHTLIHSCFRSYTHMYIKCQC